MLWGMGLIWGRSKKKSMNRGVSFVLYSIHKLIVAGVIKSIPQYAFSPSSLPGGSYTMAQYSPPSLSTAIATPNSVVFFQMI